MTEEKEHSLWSAYDAVCELRGYLEGATEVRIIHAGSRVIQIVSPELLQWVLERVSSELRSKLVGKDAGG